MKAASFDYVRAESLEHALSLLDQHGFDAKLIAGGQSLVPMMAMRLARPAVLVDINRLEELKTLGAAPGVVQMGAGVCQRTIEDNTELLRSLPLIPAALKWVGHVQTRNRGTVGGSLVHADPSAELPLAAVMLDATLHLRSSNDTRVVPASEFFMGPMFTAVGENECLTQIDWPLWSGDVIVEFEEVAMRHGDFAIASAACQLQFDASGVCTRAALGLGGVDGTPRAFPALAAQLVGQRITEGLAREVAHQAAKQIEPGSDMHADAAFRRHLAVVLLVRILQRGAARNAATAMPTHAPIMA